jgi:rhodanese-related sulfurtransferase
MMSRNCLLCLNANLIHRTLAIGLFLVGNVFLAMPTQAQVALLFGDLTWPRVNAYLDKEYADVGSITTKELAALETSSGSQGSTTRLLLDIRDKEEFEVSHLPNAILYTKNNATLEVTPKSTPIVVYCSVGLRSAAIARQLKEKGFTNVKNLRGSIFMWTNENRPLAGRFSDKTHPYNARWGTLLDKQHHAPT